MPRETEAEKGAEAMHDAHGNESPEQKLSEVPPEYLQEVKSERAKNTTGVDFDELAPEPGDHADDIIGPETKGTGEMVPENAPYALTPLSEEGVGETSPTGANLGL